MDLEGLKDSDGLCGFRGIRWI